jgi:hypothetical protein
MLMNMKAGTEAMRAFVAKLLYLADAGEHDPDPEERRKAAQRVELLTPLVKAYLSDFGYLLTREAIQLMGGVGYCSEFPAEQYARDIKIVSIWEGTSYIQSLDLVGRKLGIAGGSVFQEWIQEVMAFSGKNKEDTDLAKDFKLLFKAAQATGDIAMKFMQYFQEGKMSLIPLSSVRFLECFAETVMAHLMLEQALIARDRLKGVEAGSADGIFYKGKLETAKFFCRNILTNVFSRYTAIQQEDTSAVDIPEGAF